MTPFQRMNAGMTLLFMIRSVQSMSMRSINTALSCIPPLAVDARRSSPTDATIVLSLNVACRHHINKPPSSSAGPSRPGSSLYRHRHTIRLATIHRLSRLLDFLQHGLVRDGVLGRYIGGLRVEGDGEVFDACGCVSRLHDYSRDGGMRARQMRGRCRMPGEEEGGVWWVG